MIEQTGTKPAPGKLRLIQTFVNSAEPDDAREDFGTPAQLGEWLLERGLIDATSAGGLGEDALRAAREAREALRSMLLANNGANPDPAALATVERQSRRARLALRFQPDGSAALAPDATGIEGALGAIFAVAFEAMIEGSWTRLKACPEATCKWAFFDHSRNRSGTWCTMATCGNRHKARQYRDRKRSTATPHP
jgi:predicted RNA-binding Zn ribbon-like protein